MQACPHLATSAQSIACIDQNQAAWWMPKPQAQQPAPSSLTPNPTVFLTSCKSSRPLQAPGCFEQACRRRPRSARQPSRCQMRFQAAASKSCPHRPMVLCLQFLPGVAEYPKQAERHTAILDNAHWAHQMRDELEAKRHTTACFPNTYEPLDSAPSQHIQGGSAPHRPTGSSLHLPNPFQPA
ncbi:hypothetical protein D3C71_1015530 [compost metagenome]